MVGLDLRFIFQPLGFYDSMIYDFHISRYILPFFKNRV